ncbi:MAG: hypothetical protein ATN36_04390 [Epulopiscium sp. Nele67-Bin005]|nr:MAG: hypothetical protein ATN36_04390 [Epulopiscium sp. Nele67-Bin005]
MFGYLADTKANNRPFKKIDKNKVDKVTLNMMKRGYQEMADINLAISKLYFQVESEVQSYYDCIVESE